jgi:hypothetical protein
MEHASGLVHCEHQVGFSAGEKIRGKQSFEKMCIDNGVVVQDYLTDSGTFKANKFVAHINETQQMMHFLALMHIIKMGLQKWQYKQYPT